MKKTSKMILMSVLTIVACISLISGATFALFTSESKIDIAVTSGKVSVSTHVSDVQIASDITDEYPADAWQTIAEDGGVFTGNFANGGAVVYTVASNKLELSEITPGDAVKFTLQITNSSTVAAKYMLRVGAKDDDGLFELLKITANGTQLTGSPAVISDWTPLDATSGEEVPVDSLDMVIALPSAITSAQAAEKSCSVVLTLIAVQGNGQTCADTNLHNFVDDVCTWCGAANPFAAKYEFDDDYGTYEVNGLPDGVEIADLVIPGEINGMPVSIGMAAFYMNQSIRTVVIGEGITEIPSNSRSGVFYNCRGLNKVTIPSTLREIGENAFYSCTGLKEIVFAEPSQLKNIDSYAFRWCAFESVILPEGLTYLADDAFDQCFDLKTLSIPGTLKYIGEDSFRCCPLENLTLNDGIKGINEGAFSASHFASVNIPGSVTFIGEWCFGSSSHPVTNVTIGSADHPSELTTVGEYALYGCEYLTFYGSEAACRAAFGNRPRNKDINVTCIDGDSTTTFVLPAIDD